MGDRVWYLAYEGPLPAGLDAVAMMAKIATVLRDGGWIAGEDDPEAVLGEAEGPVYRPGPTAILQRPDFHFAGMRTNGAEFVGRPIFNAYALGWPSELACPHCGWRFADEALSDFDYDLAGRMIDILGTKGAAANFAADAASCLRCGAGSAVNDWQHPDGFLLAGAGIALWNWPVVAEIIDPLQGVMRDALPGHRLLQDGYKI